MANRKRNIQLTFWVSEEENYLINQRMKETGFKDRSKYLRKRAIDTHLINVHTEGLNALKNEISKIGVNINQLVRKYHYEGNLDKIDIELLQNYMKKIIQIANKEDDKVQGIYKLDKRNEG
ncbi:plasmid mobilization protein [Clostridium formicaceticum]|uniref:Bacterial mobilization protein (MobC) n=1 Tax=Clostridium formicaceticum TaxID=1497 RepID=A0AAC9RS07_9CLOT|nr:plasmid mobilization relaxosome protein MobC [Clostridium formicaceticum]AOY74720.1 hypothetical protein BJL90_01375 [Clostridium formicaceticum]ARE89105.1 Bacterial mobilization protein (MobC) [Clostridium formicaceticum]